MDKSEVCTLVETAYGPYSGLFSVFFSFYSDGCTQTIVCPRCGLASLFPSTLISASPRQL